MRCPHSFAISSAKFPKLCQIDRSFLDPKILMTRLARCGEFPEQRVRRVSRLWIAFVNCALGQGVRGGRHLFRKICEAIPVGPDRRACL